MTFISVVSLKAIMFFFNHVTCCIILSSPNHGIRQVTGIANHCAVERNSTGFSVNKRFSVHSRRPTVERKVLADTEQEVYQVPES
jgi:hypothetical protein